MGILNINGGLVRDTRGYIGTYAGSTGMVTVASGSLTILQDLYVGEYGQGTLNVNGGIVEGVSGGAYIGNQEGSVGVVTVTSGTWGNVGELYIGVSGNGALFITDTGVAEIYGLWLATGTASNGTLNIGSGGIAGTLLDAWSVTGGAGTATVNFNHTGDYTFAPQLTGTMTVNKLASGTTFVTGSCSYAGDTNVSGGALVFAQDFTNTRTISVTNGALLSGSGNLTNSGTMRVTGGAVLATSGTFTNNGVLDVMTAGGALPANFVNNGVVLDSSAVKVAETQVSGADMTVSIQSYAGHGYQLRRRASLAGGTWEDVGVAQNGTGGVLTFTDTGGASAAQGFYRVVVSP
jgi:autotransporter family porin